MSHLSRQLFWKLCLVIATGVVALFYLIDQITSETEEGMSLLAQADRDTITQWGQHAEQLYLAGDIEQLEQWLAKIKQQENTYVSVVDFEVEHIAGDATRATYYDGYNMGRSVDWKIHLYFAENPTMEVPFKDKQASFLIQLPERMRPGGYWRYVELTLQVIVPTILLILLTIFLYRYIMKPLAQLQKATRNFSRGQLDVSARQLMGQRRDEFGDLATGFDQMAARISEQIISQRQLIADMSHELRTPLTRLDIALEQLKQEFVSENSQRIERESQHIRKLVEDSLALAWLENERPELQQESMELVDLIDVITTDARYEYPDREITADLPDSVVLHNTSHRAAGQAIENILRNALRYTPVGGVVQIKLVCDKQQAVLDILDQGPGVPEELLSAIFKPFFRVDKSRERAGNSFGLGLSLAQRQLTAIGASVVATNHSYGGLQMRMTFPIAKGL
ncbi:sensor histidine kinase [Shewanella sp. WXL01]|uniref:sensor histidine kinase n=1 Tax=Shewanella sp. WXL01 TaxID=2709721 RepID=UPI0014384FD6|nr:sensor histidine kinase [Shewanella sp. WXL01]NKF52291.1 sensor histidine kinase [Shewanella sp. WXL01]